MEIWKPIEGYNGRYEISSFGRIKSYAQDKINGKIKNGNKTFKGYLTIVLYNSNGEKETVPIHRLVAQAFIPNPNNYPQVNHIDENKENNHVENLEWCDNSYNVNYGTRNQRAAKSNECCPTTSCKIYSIDINGKIEYYDSIGEAERQTGLSHSNIVRTLKGRTHTCGKKQWFYC